jgi:hypothetical protein
MWLIGIGVWIIAALFYLALIYGATRNDKEE